MKAREKLRRGALVHLVLVWGFFLAVMSVIFATEAEAEDVVVYQLGNETISLDLHPYSREYLYCSDGSFDPKDFLVTADVTRKKGGICTKKIHTIRRSPAAGGSLVTISPPACSFEKIRLDFAPWSEGTLYDVCKKNGPGDARLEKRLSFGLYDKKNRLVRSVEFGPVTAVVHCPARVPDVRPGTGAKRPVIINGRPCVEGIDCPQDNPSSAYNTGQTSQEGSASGGISYWNPQGPTCTVETHTGQMSSAIDLNRPAGLPKLPTPRPVKDMRLPRSAGLCDLSGDWQQRNTRTNEVHPLVWRIQRLTNEGTSDVWNYEVTRYKNGQRYAPPSSGRLYQSTKETLIFFDTPASMTQYNLSRIMSRRELTVRPGCQVMEVRSISSNWKGSRNLAAGVLVMERKGVRTGGPAPIPPRPGTELKQPVGSKVPQIPAPKTLPGWRPVK